SITLDVPIDPNLVISINGRPLQRVRDWRGRATSVLPPVQSLSDVPTTNNTAHGVATRSLLEVDTLQANSWFAVNSHNLIVNVSRTLAGDEDFPIIQISDPGKQPLVLPNDLDRGFSELIINAFRLIPRTEPQIKQRIGVRLASHTSFLTPPNKPAENQGKNPATTTNQDEGDLRSRREQSNRDEFTPESGNEPPLAGGPYPASTFIPLFLAEPTARVLYPFIGRTAKE